MSNPATSVSPAPKVTSKRPRPPNTFATMQPIQRANAAHGPKKYGRRVRASETLIWIGPKEIGASRIVTIAYKAPSRPISATLLVSTPNHPSVLITQVLSDWGPAGPLGQSHPSHLISFQTPNIIGAVFHATRNSLPQKTGTDATLLLRRVCCAADGFAQYLRAP